MTLGDDVLLYLIVGVIGIFCIIRSLLSEKYNPSEEVVNVGERVEKKDKVVEDKLRLWGDATEGEVAKIAEEAYFKALDDCRLRTCHEDISEADYFSKNFYKCGRARDSINHYLVRIGAAWYESMEREIRDLPPIFVTLLRSSQVRYKDRTKVGDHYYMYAGEGKGIYLNSCEYSLYSLFVDNKGRFKPKVKPVGCELHAGQSYLLDTETGIEFFKDYKYCGMSTKVTPEGWEFLTRVVVNHYTECKERWTEIARIRAERPMLKLYCNCEEKTND